MHKSHSSKPNDNQAVRLDKWLWAARFFKTRAVAKAAIEGGKIHYNNSRVKPSKMVELSAKVQIRQGWDEKEVIILAISDQRRGAPEAQKLYTETPESIVKREKLAQDRKQLQTAQFPPARRPTKKQRRQIHRFKENDFNSES
jgi:ribosome-associated heat shock protein Hsp15